MRRRKLLKTVGASSALYATVGTISAKSSEGDSNRFKKDMQRALSIGSSQGNKGMEKFFEENGYSYASKTVEESFSLGPDDTQTDDGGTPEIEPDAINDPQDGGVKVTIGATDGSDAPGDTDMYAWLSVAYKFSASCAGSSFIPDSHGEDPRDAAGIAWNSRQNEYFELADGGGESAMDASGQMDHHVKWNEDLHEPTVGRTSFRFDDKEIYNLWEDVAVDNNDCGLLDPGKTEEGVYPAGVCGVYLSTIGDWEPDRRVVRASYTHAHGVLNISPTLSFSASGPAIGFSPSIDITEHRISTDSDGNNLEVHQSEII
ncbi:MULTISPECIES: hypothetical protein [Natrialbaceae]|uniref:hypothetical protein n=1 Tax=Natrialbaceae TaxID=1644061 RepID=UPI001114BBAF|nr:MULTISPECIES: hypothetical protein [Natrialbaceae]